MGRFRDWLKKTSDEYWETDYYYRLGCEILGPQPHYTSVIERTARIAEGKREHARREAALTAERQRRFGQAAIRAYNRVRQMAAVQSGRDLQYEDGDCRIKVKHGYHWGDGRGVGSNITDVIVVDCRDPHGGHLHVVFDENGNTIHNEWRTYQ